MDRLATQILERGVATDETVNPFWRGQLANFAERIVQDGQATIEAVYTLGYWEETLPEGQANAELPAFREALAAAKAGRPDGLGAGQAEHAGALAVLRRSGLMADYLETLDRLRIVSGMSIARHYVYLRRLMREWAGPGRMLEIGAGGGHFARLAISAGLAQHYVIVDLPEMLLNSAGTLIMKAWRAELHLGEAPDFSAAGLHVWLLATTEIALVPDRSVDVALNFNSFMEMDEEVRDGYLDQVYRTAKPGALFYNVNRMQRAMTRRDGSTYENNPLLYPYRPTDQVIEWQPDELQQSQRASPFHAPSTSFAISRLARLA